MISDTYRLIMKFCLIIEYKEYEIEYKDWHRYLGSAELVCNAIVKIINYQNLL